MCAPLILGDHIHKSRTDFRKALVLLLIQVNVLFALTKWLLYVHTDEEQLQRATNIIVYIFVVINIPTFTTYLEMLEETILKFTNYLWRRKV